MSTRVMVNTDLATFTAARTDEDYLDNWPTLPDGAAWDGAKLLALASRGQCPFRDWDIYTLGFHVTLSSRPDIIARLSRGDINNHLFRLSPSFHEQLGHGRFELATYDALEDLGFLLSRRPLYHREPVSAQDSVHTLTKRQGITGRRLYVFEKADGGAYDYPRWRALTTEHKTMLLIRSAQIAAEIFQFRTPKDYVSTWLTDRLFGAGHELQAAAEPTREFCILLVGAQVEYTFQRLVASGAASDSEITAESKVALLKLIPLIVPRERDVSGASSLFRFVLDHGDYGIHNMTIAFDRHGHPIITSIFDWETASIVPALLSESKMIVTVDLVIGDNGEPCISRWGDGDTPAKMVEYQKWSDEYHQALFQESPDYRRIIFLAKDIRYVWFTLRRCAKEFSASNWRELGAWAEATLAELSTIKG